MKKKEYWETLQEHIVAVQHYGRKLHIPELQLIRHDQSKWSNEEFKPYAKFFSNKDAIVEDPSVTDEFVAAWLHHIHHNPHHWQYWIFPDGYSPPRSSLENGVMAMPERYALEMIADWHGAGKVYQGSWDIANWLSLNIPRMIVHSDTANFLRNTLSNLGYAHIVHAVNFKNESGH